jgi:hypothetical protein
MVLLGDEAQVDAPFGPFGDSANLDAILVHDFALNIPQAQKSFWTHPIQHLGDVGHVKSHFSPFRDRVSTGGRWVHGLRQTYHSLRNYFERTRWYSKVTRLKWMLDSVRLEIVLFLMQDRCTVCAECTTGSKITLETPDRTSR